MVPYIAPVWGDCDYFDIYIYIYIFKKIDSYEERLFFTNTKILYILWNTVLDGRKHFIILFSVDESFQMNIYGEIRFNILV